MADSPPASRPEPNPWFSSPPLTGGGAAGYDLDALLGPEAYGGADPPAPPAATPATLAAAPDAVDKAEVAHAATKQQEEIQAVDAAAEEPPAPVARSDSPPLPSGGMSGRGGYDLSALGDADALPPGALPGMDGATGASTAVGDARPLGERLVDKVRSLQRGVLSAGVNGRACSLILFRCTEAQDKEGRFC